MDLIDGLVDLCSRLSTEEVFAGLTRLNDKDSRTLAQIIAVLSELHKRRAALDKGYPSLFKYCTEVLRYSEDQACMRIRTAKSAASFPSVLRYIADRSLSITAVSRLHPHLTSANHKSLLAKAASKTLHEVDRIIRGVSPEIERRPVIRALSVGADEATIPSNDSGQACLLGNRGPDEEVSTYLPSLSAEVSDANPTFMARPAFPTQSPGIGPSAMRPAAAADPLASVAGIEPGTAPPAGDPSPAPQGRVLFHFAASERFRAKFNRARELSRHAFPSGSPEGIFEDALDRLLDVKDPERRLARKERRRRAAAARSRTSPRKVHASGVDFAPPL